MLGVELDQLLLKCRELEIVILFLDGLGRAAAIWARSARLRIDIKFIRNAILPGVGSFIDVTVVADFTPQRLHSLFVPVGSGTYEIDNGYIYKGTYTGQYCVSD